MSSKKQKGQGNNASTSAKPKIVPVAEGSLQSRAPGSGPGPRPNEQNSLTLGARQAENMASQGGQYGGIGKQLPRFSARQHAQRIQARAEEDRLGEPRQSGWGGIEQYQHAGSQEGSTGKGNLPETKSAQGPASANQPPSDFVSRRKPGGKPPSR